MTIKEKIEQRKEESKTKLPIIIDVVKSLGIKKAVGNDVALYYKDIRFGILYCERKHNLIVIYGTDRVFNMQNNEIVAYRPDILWFDDLLELHETAKEIIQQKEIEKVEKEKAELMDNWGIIL